MSSSVNISLYHQFKAIKRGPVDYSLNFWSKCCARRKQNLKEFKAILISSIIFVNHFTKDQLSSVHQLNL